jgi:ABC-type multidrug transport system permease subunit
VSKEPYLALLIAALLLVPVILWNVEHDWASFGFQLNERLNRPDDQPLESFGEFLLTQIVVSFPALLAGLLMISVFPFSLGLIDRRIKWHFCFLFSLPFLAFLLVVSVHSRIKANWTLPGYLSLLVAAYPCYRHLRFNSGRSNEGRRQIFIGRLSLRVAGHVSRRRLPLDRYDPRR